MLCGVDEAIAILHTFAVHPEELVIEALNDGDMISANEPVLKVTGTYENFGFLDTCGLHDARYERNGSFG